MSDQNTKLIHDMNSGLSALDQALEILGDREIRTDDLVDQIAPLSLEKVKTLILTWEQLRPKLD